MKKTAKAKIKEKFLEKAKISSSRLEVQGDLAKLCEEEKSEIDWKAVIWKVPKGRNIGRNKFVKYICINPRGTKYYKLILKVYSNLVTDSKDYKMVLFKQSDALQGFTKGQISILIFVIICTT